MAKNSHLINKLADEAPSNIQNSKFKIQNSSCVALQPFGAGLGFDAFKRQGDIKGRAFVFF